jgi:hypothetical protein
VSQGKHRRKPRRGLAAAAIALTGTLTLVLVGAQLARAPAAQATGSAGAGTTFVVDVTLNFPADVVRNHCNGDAVYLFGDQRIITRTTIYPDGSSRVQSTLIAKDLRGHRLQPPMIGYQADNLQNTFTYWAPPPQPSTFRAKHWTKLVPKGNAPTMYLVIVLRETITATGTVPVFYQAYIVCTQPKCSAERE